MGLFLTVVFNCFLLYSWVFLYWRSGFIDDIEVPTGFGNVVFFVLLGELKWDLSNR